MKNHFSAAELAGIPGMPTTERGVQLLAQRDGWPHEKRAGRGGGKQYPIARLPPETQAALTLRSGTVPTVVASSSDREARRVHLWATYDRKPDNLKAKAAERLRLLQAVEQLVGNSTPLLRAIAHIADQADVPAVTLRRWRGLVKGLDRSDWLPALAPRWSGRTATVECSPEAWDYFKADYLRLGEPCAEACYRRLQAAGEGRDWIIPACRTLVRRVEREFSPMMICLARQGAEAAKRMYPAQERDRSVFRALEAINGDGHKLDVFAKFEDGTIGRPLIAVWQDLYSGKILAWRVGDAETAELVRLALADVIERFGIPEKCWMDNGRAYASKQITGGTGNRYRNKIKPEDPQGILTLLGVEIHWTLPYSGQSKPIERAFRDWAQDIATHPFFDGAYTGNSPTAKPENYGSKAIPIADVRRIVAEVITASNARPGRRAANCDGRSFDETFNESYADALIRKATAEQRRLLLLAAEGVTANRDDGSVRLDGNRYWTDAPALARAAGDRVIVRFDPQDYLKPVHIYALNGAFIATAELVEKAGFDNVEQARSHARARKTYIRAQKDQLAAEVRMTALEAAAMLPAAADPLPPPETKIVRPLFSRGATALKAEPAMSQQEFEANFSQGVAAMRRARGLSE